MRDYNVIIFGSYGYTGDLIVEECKVQQLQILLAGRNTEKLQEQSFRTGYPFTVLDLNNKTSLVDLLKKTTLVVHCGGPFQYTAKQMVEACLEAGTHYTDISGEYTVFEKLAAYDALAKKSGILIMPGVGFDVVPSDCLALYLKKELPSATHLQLAFMMTKGGVSKGTAKTMVEGLGYGGMIRKDSKLIPIHLGDKIMEINFGAFKAKAICIPWGDISTAWRSTGIPNIEVYSGVPEKLIRAAKMSRWFNWVLRRRSIKNFLLKRIDKRPAGPSREKRQMGKTYLWGKVWDDQGHAAEKRLETLSGYNVTAKSAVLIAQKIISEEVRAGYFTPAQYFGEDLILSIAGTKFY